ncbi:MAG: hypothetical protein FIB00_17665 [Chloroflexi bacterium]|nr:hypothetical protein [Chloroflexota bacterium]PWB43832.1 MAG: hypothetical protein C3F10_10385 [Dehalococcoidia bacterium]
MGERPRGFQLRGRGKAFARHPPAEGKQDEEAASAKERNGFVQDGEADAGSGGNVAAGGGISVAVAGVIVAAVCGAIRGNG